MGSTICRDQSPLSSKCSAKGCNKCVTSRPSQNLYNTKPTEIDMHGKDPMYNFGKPIETNKYKKNELSVVSFTSTDPNFKSFALSKKFLKTVYKNGGQSFYCNEHFDESFHFKSFKSYKPQNIKSKRSYRMEFEHIVPAENFGRHFKSWRAGDLKCITKKGKAFKGRNCARKISEKFRLMEADPINLVPSIGAINGRRSNYRYAEIEGEKREFGTCDVEISNKRFEPRDSVKGDVARTYRYMA